MASNTVTRSVSSYLTALGLNLVTLPYPRAVLPHLRFLPSPEGAQSHPRSSPLYRGLRNPTHLSWDTNLKKMYLGHGGGLYYSFGLDFRTFNLNLATDTSPLA